MASQRALVLSSYSSAKSSEGSVRRCRANEQMIRSYTPFTPASDTGEDVRIDCSGRRPSARSENERPWHGLEVRAVYAGEVY
jgi:hypothetical protein